MSLLTLISTGQAITGMEGGREEGGREGGGREGGRKGQAITGSFSYFDKDFKGVTEQ